MKKGKQCLKQLLLVTRAGVMPTTQKQNDKAHYGSVKNGRDRKNYTFKNLKLRPMSIVSISILKREIVHE